MTSATATMKEPPRIGLRHVALYVDRLEAAVDFWVQVMGYAIEWKPDPDNVYLTTGGDNLALHRHPVEDGDDARLDHIGLAVPRAEDVDAWANHLAAHGIELERGPKTHRDGARSLYFRDPGGTRVQIIHHPPLHSPPP